MKVGRMVNESDGQNKSHLNNDNEESNKNARIKDNVKFAVAEADSVTKDKEEDDTHNVKWFNASHGNRPTANYLLADSLDSKKVVKESEDNAQGFSDIHNLGDYTNIRATIGPLGVKEGVIHKTVADSTHDPYGSGNSRNILHAQSQQQQQHPVQPAQASAFSFKHFLSNCNVLTAPSSTVTFLDSTIPNIMNSTVTSFTTTTSKTLQTSTGTRPKVPQSNSAAYSSMPLIRGSSVSGNLSSINNNNIEKINVTTTAFLPSSKMKRSPRFSSFDSQASLAEYVDTTPKSQYQSAATVVGVTSSSTEYESWNLPSTSSNTASVIRTTKEKDNAKCMGQYVHRSYSNCDMAPSQTSPCKRQNALGDVIKETRPARLSLNCTTANSSCASGKGNAKLKLDLPLYKCSTTFSNTSNTSNTSVAHRTKNLNTFKSTDLRYRTNNTNNMSANFQNAAAPPPPGIASALPDFVQDHWMDSWYSHDTQVKSPNASPTDEFFEDSNGTSDNLGIEQDTIKNQIDPLNSLESRAGTGDIALSGANSSVNHNINVPETNSGSVSGSKMLPDFLSDGPIIHSSQRLADIATGLPSSIVGSPQDSSIPTQLTRLRQENERLQNDLAETRRALSEQTKRANDLEYQLTEYHKARYKLGNNENVPQKAQSKTELLNEDETKEHIVNQSHSVEHNQELELKKQIIKLTTELEALRQERELTREGGAFGGFNVSTCDCSSTTNTAGGAAASSVEMSGNIRNSGTVTNSIRSSRSQQFARQLLTAAANAEGNLRQLLAGVDNLRQMAADIERNVHFECSDANPDLFSDFLDECDNVYDKFNADK